MENVAGGKGKKEEEKEMEFVDNHFRTSR